MSAYLLTNLAKADIFQIWCYIAEDNEEAANEVDLAIRNACQFLAASPQLGHSRPGFSNRRLRFWTLTRYPNYSIAYHPGTNPVTVVAVFHGNRDIRTLLKSRLF